MKYLYKFMEVYIWITLAVLCLLGAAQNFVYGHTSTGIGFTIVMVVFMYVFKREKNRVN